MYTYAELREKAISIKEFGLGFIQVKFNDDHLLNFYTDKVPLFTNATAPHNHETDFVSTILNGSLFETVYEVEVNNSCGVSAFCGCGDIDKVITDKYTHRIKSVHIHEKDVQYKRSRFEFHSVIGVPNTITEIKKFNVDQTIDAIVLAVKSEYISSGLTEYDLWKIVEEILEIETVYTKFKP